MKDVVIIGMLKSYISKTLVGMGALKGAPCTVKSITDNGDGTQTLTLEWVDTAGVSHTTDVSLPAAMFAVTSPSNGQTLRYNSTSGKFENSNVSFSANLDDLDNVLITSVQDGQVLTYDAATNKWINSNGSTVAALSDLTDVTITTAQNGQLLSYNSTSNKWVNITLNIDDLGNVSITSASDGQILTYDAANSRWVNADISAEENVIDTVKVNGTALTPDANKAVNVLLAMDKLSDVDLTSLADENILIYDATNQKWIAGANTGATYTAGEGIEIDQNNKISSKIVLFTGTEALWEALPLADKVKFTHYATNDSQTGQIDPVPTQNSANLMTSGGIYTALQAKANTADLGTAAAKDSTNAVTQSSTDLLESGAAYTALQNKADKVTGATADNFAGLDSNGNLKDSGKSASDFATELLDFAANADFNDLYARGKTKKYLVSGTLTNAPTTDANVSWYLISFCNDDQISVNSYATQIATNASNINKNDVYVRHLSLSDGWTAWQKLLSVNDLVSTPTSGSSSPITSGGVYSAINDFTSGATNVTNVNWVKFGRVVILSAKGHNNSGSSPLTENITGAPTPLNGTYELAVTMHADPTNGVAGYIQVQGTAITIKTYANMNAFGSLVYFSAS